MVPHAQARLEDKEAAEREAARLQADNLQLAARLVEMKESEMQRMEDTNRMCEQMVRRRWLPSPISRSHPRSTAPA